MGERPLGSGIVLVKRKKKSIDQKSFEKRASDTHQTPIRHPSDTHQTPIRHPSDTHQTRIRHPSDTHQTRIRHPSDTHQTPIRHPSDTHQTPIRHPSDTHQTPIRHPSDTHQTPIRHPPKLTSNKHQPLSKLYQTTTHHSPPQPTITADYPIPQLTTHYHNRPPTTTTDHPLPQPTTHYHNPPPTTTTHQPLPPTTTTNHTTTNLHGRRFSFMQLTHHFLHAAFDASGGPLESLIAFLFQLQLPCQRCRLFNSSPRLLYHALVF